jgi:hypothetical protein
MKHAIVVMIGLLALSGMEACSSGDNGARAGGAKGTGGALGSGGAVSSGGVKGTGGASTSGGQVSSGGAKETGGSAKSGGKSGSGGQSGGGATGSSGKSAACPYTVASFSCEAACANLHDLYTRCKDDPSVPAEMQAMLGLYGQMEVICTSTCDVVAPASQAQWSCLQGVPDDAPCSAIGGCNATNCP